MNKETAPAECGSGNRNYPVAPDPYLKTQCSIRPGLETNSNAQEVCYLSLLLVTVGYNKKVILASSYKGVYLRIHLCHNLP
jgi:hypothetical protein